MKLKKKIKIVTCELETERKRDKDVELILVLCGHRTWGINFPTLGLSKEIWWLVFRGGEYMSAYMP